MLSRMLSCSVIIFHDLEVDGMFGRGGNLWYLIKLFKGLDELPSGLVVVVGLSRRVLPRGR